MKLWNGVTSVVILILGLSLIAFNVLLYTFLENQKIEMDTLNQQQQIVAQVNSNQFKYQQQQIERLSKSLDRLQQQTKDQKEALIEQKDDNHGLRTSLADVRAEADAVKQQVKGWQKDYSSVLAQLEKKSAETQKEVEQFDNGLAALNIPALKDNIDSLKQDIDKMIRSQAAAPAANAPMSDTPPPQSSQEFNGT